MSRRFVDREEETDLIRDFAETVARERGGTYVFEGLPGAGRTALLNTLASLQDELPLQVVRVSGRPVIGPRLPFGLVLDIIDRLREHDRKSAAIFKRVAKSMMVGLAKLDPGVLDNVYPGLGKAFTLGGKMIQAGRDSASNQMEALLPVQHAVAVKFADAMLKHARRRPVLLLVDDFQFTDLSSLYVIDRLIAKLSGAPLGVVLSRGTAEVEDGADIEDLLGYWSSHGLAVRRTLPGLPPEAVAELVAELCPGAPPDLPDRLLTATHGNAAHVTWCLDSFDPARPDRLAVPENIQQEAERLGPLDQKLLAVAAVQGDRFDTQSVATVADMDHVDVQAHCVELRRRSIIEPEDREQGGAADDYRFRSELWRSACYRLQSAGQRRVAHTRFADLLREDDSYEALLLRAHHLARGTDDCLAESALVHCDLAWSVAGASPAMAEQMCDKALEALSKLPESAPGRDLTFVRAVDLRLSITETRWNVRSGEGRDLEGLAAAGVEAARRLDDPKRLIRMLVLHGKVLLATRRVEPGLHRLEAALEAAERAGDPVSIYIAKVEYGRQVSKRDLETASRVLGEAERMLDEHVGLRDGDDWKLVQTRDLAAAQSGITLFDRGFLSESLERLTTVVDRMRDHPTSVAMPIAFNYLSQVQVAIGDHASAERTLSEALGSEEGVYDAEPGQAIESNWHAYNRAMLCYCRALTDPQDPTILADIVDAYEESERVGARNIAPIVRNLYAEIQLITGQRAAPETGDRDAVSLASRTVEETQKSGMIRSEIAAHSLHSRALLRDGDLTGALESARRAVDRLGAAGDMPALRSEEVRYHTAAVFAATGYREDASEQLRQARELVEQKSKSITEADLRNRFLTEVALNRAIRDGEGVDL